MLLVLKISDKRFLILINSYFYFSHLEKVQLPNSKAFHRILTFQEAGSLTFSELRRRCPFALTATGHLSLHRQMFQDRKIKERLQLRLKILRQTLIDQ
jgi:hypothetical protein